MPCHCAPSETHSVGPPKGTILTMSAPLRTVAARLRMPAKAAAVTQNLKRASKKSSLFLPSGVRFEAPARAAFGSPARAAGPDPSAHPQTRGLRAQNEAPARRPGRRPEKVQNRAGPQLILEKSEFSFDFVIYD